MNEKEMNQCGKKNESAGANSPVQELKLTGVGVSSGIVTGIVYQFASENFSTEKIKIDDDKVENEISRFYKGLKKTTEEMRELQKKIDDEVGKEHAYIFEVHLLVLEDEFLIEKTINRVRKEKFNVEYILSEVVEDFAKVLFKSSDSYLRGRAEDIRDVKKRLLRNLAGKQEKSLLDIDTEVIVVAHDLSPADTIMMHKEKVVGFVTDIGSRTSHTAIMARSLEIPAVVALKDVSKKARHGDRIVVDGTEGIVYINPGSAILKEYGKKRIRFEVNERELRDLRQLPAQTMDGHVIKLMANMELADELSSALTHGADGIGLYRTEFFYLDREDLPAEDEQYEVYSQVAKKIAPHPVIIRTMDIGGDKFVSQLEISQELNPFMGWRGIRFSLEQHEVFEIQLRAILRAGSEGSVSVMFPMVSNLNELRQAKEILEKVKIDLRKDGKNFNENMEVGVMIETPSAAMIAEVLAKEADFFSVGTNDLIQYSIAIDRVNEKVAYLYRPSHPGVLKLIEKIVSAGHNENIRVDICGEMAGDSLFAIFLIGIGMDGLSMSPSAIPSIKKIIRSITMRRAREIALDVVKLSTADEVDEVLKEAHENSCLHKTSS